MKICDAIKLAREQKKMTLQEIADKLKTSKQLVSAWEIGKCTPTARHIHRLFNMLGISLQIKQNQVSPADAKFLASVEKIGGDIKKIFEEKQNGQNPTVDNLAKL